MIAFPGYGGAGLSTDQCITNYPNERSSKFARDKDEQEYTRKKRNTRTKQVTGDTNVTITRTVKVA